jgi:hypothetical protein
METMRSLVLEIKLNNSDVTIDSLCQLLGAYLNKAGVRGAAETKVAPYKPAGDLNPDLLTYGEARTDG